ncbi:MAG: hypothetical protein H0V77_11430 [Actinobacteria bacterium]|nr:hypothetical protein [Actinomycetota bacterium]
MARTRGDTRPDESKRPLHLVVGDSVERPETDDYTKLWPLQRILDDRDRFQAMIKTFQKALEPTMEIHKWAR